MGNDLSPILVTGASGYLGKQVIERLDERGLQSISVGLSNRTSSISCDLTKPQKVQKLFEQTNPSAIIHCAAIVPKTAAEYSNRRAAENSVSMLQNLAEVAPCKIVFPSSMTVYAKAQHFPVFEDDVQIPDTGYAYGKWVAEQILLNRQLPGDVVFRLPGLFGLPRRSGLLYNATKAFLTEGTFDVNPSSGIWAAMAVQDAAEYLIKAALTSSTHPAQAINMGYPGEFTVISAVEKIAKICNIEWERSPAHEIPFSMCLDRLESRHGLLKATFEQRLKEFVNDVRMDLRNTT